MTDLTDDDLRNARAWAEETVWYFPADTDGQNAARAILEYVPDPGPERIAGWDESLVGTWAEDEDGSVYLLLDEDGRFVDVYEPGGRDKVGLSLLSTLTPRPDLAPVDLTPRPVGTEPEATPRTVTTEDEYAALPEGSVVAGHGHLAWTKREEGWYASPYTTNRDAPATTMVGLTRTVLREGWGE